MYGHASEHVNSISSPISSGSPSRFIGTSAMNFCTSLGKVSEGRTNGVLT
jgi:hypothetical protein